jgi:hypothetical protein
MEALRQEKSEGSEYKEIRRGWRFGSEEFVSRMLDRIAGGCSENQTRREQDESMEQRAARIVAEGLRKADWSAERLKTEQKGHPLKGKRGQSLPLTQLAHKREKGSVLVIDTART